MTLIFQWREVDVPDPSTGEVQLRYAMVPLPHYRTAAERQFGDGKEYELEVVPEQFKENMRGHKAYIISMQEYWRNLPEAEAKRFPTADHFRKWCLIECRYFDERIFGEYVTKEMAQVAGFYMRELDAFARITPPYKVEGGGWVFGVRRAKSQSPRLTKMPLAELKQSRKDCEDLASSFVGVRPSEMRKHAGRSA